MMLTIHYTILKEAALATSQSSMKEKAMIHNNRNLNLTKDHLKIIPITSSRRVRKA